MASIQSYLTRHLIRKSNIWNRHLSEITDNLENIVAKCISDAITIRNEIINEVPCKVFLGGMGKKEKTLLYFHGGGFCLGIYPSNSEFVAEVSKIAGVDVYMPDYRLAPENPFPAALEDAVSVYKGILKKGYSADDVIVIGDSSGSALALSALQVLKQSGVRMPKALAFITPVFDLAGKGETFITRAGKDPFNLKDPLGIAKIYVGTNNPSSPVLSPLYGELEGLPPLLIHAADYDVFLDDSCRFREKAEEAGLEVELKVWRKMWHIFHMQASFVPESRKALDELCSYIRSRFNMHNCPQTDRSL